jgi:Right handed beta helix region
MIRKWLLLLLLGSPLACASNYYVDCNYGSNGNPGTSPQLAWRTLLEVGISSFQPGDTINLIRDCTWHETLTPPSSGSSGSLIKIDSYGNGQPPHLTGYLPIAAKWWTQVGTSNVWSANLYSTTSGLSTVVTCGVRGFYCLTQAPSQLDYVRCGTTWGIAQASQGALSQDRDFWYDSTNYILYVYSASGNPASHYSSVAPIALSGETMLNLNGVSWLEIQHLKIDWFDGYGVQIQGASDHVWLANISADSEVENSTVPLGFYVHPSGTPVDIHLYNTDANMNYSGYEFASPGCTSGGCAFEIKNCRAYANRAYGIVDSVDGAVSYDYCHLYANNLATAVTVDASGTPGPTAGTHNIAAETPPWVREWHRWPAYTSVTYDDPGLVQYSDTYINSLLPMMASKAIPLSIAVVTGGSYSQSIIGEVQGWINAGWDINTHSISHEYWDPPAASCGTGGPFPVPCHAFEGLQYTGNIATSVTLNISHPAAGQALMTVTPVPDDPAADITWNMTPATPGQTSNGLDTLGGILYTLEQRGVFSVNLDVNAKSTARSISLANVTNLDIFGSAQNLDLDETQMETEEMTWAQQWMNLNLTGLPTGRVYVMPGSYEDPLTENLAASLGYVGVRGTGSLKPCCGANTTLASGYDVFNILSQGAVPYYQGLSYQALRNRVSQDLFKNALWGRPIGYFWHVNELRPDEVGNFMDALVQGGATLESNTQMVNFLLSCQQNDAVPAGYVSGSYNVCPSSGTEADFRPTVNSPVRDMGMNLGTEYQYDLMGINQNSFGTGWEIGAYAYVPESFSANH